MYSMNKEKFGAFVSALRKEKEMTQKDLAAALFVSDKAVSKWETGQSLPDVSLLIPLADNLGVTVTELLQGERMEKQQSITPRQVEDIVKTAVNMAGYKAPEKFKKYRFPAYIICLITGLITQYEMSWHIYNGSDIMLFPLTLIIRGAGFGIYFLFFAPEILPDYYDTHKINYYVHGPVRIHVPGVYFNNRNWKYILNNLRIWCLFTLATSPTVTLVSGYLIEYIFVAIKPPYLSPLHRMDTWSTAVLVVTMAIYLGSLFARTFIPGRKYK